VARDIERNDPSRSIFESRGALAECLTLNPDAQKLARPSIDPPGGGSMAPAKSYSIIVVPADHSGTRQYRVSRNLLVAGAVFLSVFLLIVLLFVGTYGRVLVKARQADNLQQENQQLRAQVATVEELSRELEAMSSLRAQVMNMLGNSEVAFDELSLLGGDEQTGSSLNSLEDAESLRHLFADEARRPFAPEAWPLPGRVRREYFPKPEANEPAHPGLDIEGAPGDVVRAAGRGQVVETGYAETSGHFVVVDHGFGYRSLYAGGGSLSVEVGQTVDRGQAVAVLPPSPGRSSRNGRPLLYFEIQVDGRPVDPRRYLTPR
jgi:murein DD-endopeptidase MepM/ murein hydrolase activator NlpD